MNGPQRNARLEASKAANGAVSAAVSLPAWCSGTLNRWSGLGRRKGSLPSGRLAAACSDRGVACHLGAEQRSGLGRRVGCLTSQALGRPPCTPDGLPASQARCGDGMSQLGCLPRRRAAETLRANWVACSPGALLPWQNESIGLPTSQARYCGGTSQLGCQPRRRAAVTRQAKLHLCGRPGDR